MRMKIWFVWQLIFLCFPLIGYSALTWKGVSKDGFSAEITLSAAQINIQENLEIKLLLTFPSSYHVETDLLTTNLLKHSAISAPAFRLVSLKNELKQSGMDVSSRELDFTLEPLVPGKYPLTFFNIDFTANDDEAKNNSSKKVTTIISDIFDVEISAAPNILGAEVPPKIQPLMTFSENLPIEISEENRQKLLENSAVIKNEALKNIAELRTKTLPWKKMLLLIAFGVLAFVFRKQLIELLKEPKSQIDSVIEARKKTLAEMELLNPQNSSKFYADLSNIAREYIENRYLLHAQGDTTLEFLEKIAEKSLFDPHLQALLNDFLRQADNVKFAKRAASPEECQQALNAVKSIIID